jgi:hypothetical protein
MNIKSLDGAHVEVRRRLEPVRGDQWDLPTPCEGWSVRDLVQHLAVGATMARQILAGEPWGREATMEEVASLTSARGANRCHRRGFRRRGQVAPGWTCRVPCGVAWLPHGGHDRQEDDEGDEHVAHVCVQPPRLQALGTSR